MTNLKIAIGQMISVDNIEANLRQIENHCREASAQDAKILFLPENAIYMRLIEGQKIEGLSLTHSVFEHLQGLCQTYHLAIHLGSAPLIVEGKMFNASLFCRAEIAPEITYKKVHLFDISLENEKPIRESDQFTHGPATAPLKFGDWLFGQSICYDVRFSELYLQYAKMGVDAILVPSAFLVPTGKKHWEILIRARAIESQCYVIAAAQAGKHTGKNGGERDTFGHSLVVDPWGEILLEGSGDHAEALVVEISQERIAQVRRQIPMKDHRRL